jgi:mono/diheme cytochrome c family protein
MIAATRRVASGVAIIVALIAIVGAQAMQVRERDADWIAPPDAAAKLNPLANRPDAEAGGRKLFDRRCATCHGDDGQGTTKGPDLTAPAVQAQSDGALFWKISGGNSREGMPAFSFLPEAQRWQLVLRVRSVRDDALSRSLRHGEESWHHECRSGAPAASRDPRRPACPL